MNPAVGNSIAGRMLCTAKSVSSPGRFASVDYCPASGAASRRLSLL